MCPRLHSYFMVTSLGGFSISGGVTPNTQADYFPGRRKSVHGSFFSSPRSPCPFRCCCLRTTLLAILEKQHRIHREAAPRHLHSTHKVILLLWPGEDKAVQSVRPVSWWTSIPIHNLIQNQYIQMPEFRLDWWPLGLCSYQPTYSKMYFTILHRSICSSVLPCLLP